jgi:hypothetical protein
MSSHALYLGPWSYDFWSLQEFALLKASYYNHSEHHEKN